MNLRLGDMRQATVSLGDTPLQGLKAWLTSYRWNGWECPYFAPEELRAHREQFNEYAKIAADLLTDEGLGERFTWNEETDLPSIVTLYDDGTEQEEVSIVLTEAGTMLVTIGWAFFTWQVTADHEGES